MKKHGWYLPTLSEFFPQNPGLLGVNINGGQKICIRLRPQNDPHSFLDLEQMLVGTMLHELTHNVRGPHDKIFYKQLDELQDEYDALRAKGYSGEGFLGDGNRVGLGVSHDVSPEQARQIALKKAEERARLTKLLGHGGKLGGSKPDMKGKRIGDILADVRPLSLALLLFRVVLSSMVNLQAAERRQRDSQRCGGDDAHDHPSGSAREDLPPEILAEVERAERDSQVFVIDLTQDSDDDNGSHFSRPATSAASSSKIEQLPKSTRSASESDSDIEILLPPPKRLHPSELKSRPTAVPPPVTSPSDQPAPPFLKKPAPLRSTRSAWSCTVCTFDNVSPLSLACDMCGTERVATTTAQLAASSRPIARPDEWCCHQCASLTSHDFWTCRSCGTVKLTS